MHSRRELLPVLPTQMIMLFQDTSLVYVVSITDFLGAGKIGPRDGRLVEMHLLSEDGLPVICFSASSSVRKLDARRQHGRVVTDDAAVVPRLPGLTCGKRPPKSDIDQEDPVKSLENVVPRAWGEDCRTWELLSGGDLVVFHERMPPGTAEVEHFHNRARQFFFVLEGELSIVTKGSEQVLRRHEGLEIPPGEMHHVRNRSASSTEFLAIAHPTTVGDRGFPVP